MKDLLNKYLRKVGVKKYEDLNQEEKDTYREWESSLSGRSITDPEYREFLESELQEAIIRLTETDLSDEAEIFRKVEVRFIKKVLAFLDMPIAEKKILEQQIENRINS